MRSEYAILIPLLLQVVGLTIAVIIDPYINKHDRKIMLIIAFLVFSLISQNVSEYYLTEEINMPYVRTLVAAYGYCVRPLIIILFFFLVEGRRRFIPFWILIGVNTAVYLSALFSKLSFFISEENIFSRGPLGYTCYYISAVLLAYLS